MRGKVTTARTLRMSGRVIAGVSVLLLPLAGSASAATIHSPYEAGYRADHGTFRSVTASWTIPSVTCRGKQSTASESVILGHGGMRTTTTQTGYTGQASISTAWTCDPYTGASGFYAGSWGVDTSGGELVVKGPHGFVSFPLEPGDQITASISATSHSVTESLVNHRAGKTANVTYRYGVDQSWATVVAGGGSPARQFSSATYLAKYGQIPFYNITIVDTRSHQGSFAPSAHWKTTTVEEFDGSRLAASPSSLTQSGTAFTDIWNHR